MTGYPVMLNLTGKAVVVVGGGKIAARKIARLIEADAVVTVISPKVVMSIKHHVQDNQVRWLKQPYRMNTLSRCYPVLVFAATESEQINRQIAADSRRIGAWVNVLSESGESDFHNVAVIEHPPLTIGISTNGTSPALLKMIKARIEQAIGEHFNLLSEWLGEIRPNIKENVDEQTHRQQLYEHIVQSDVLDLLQTGEIEAARLRFNRLVDEVLV